MIVPLSSTIRRTKSPGDPDGSAIDGFAFTDYHELFGDTVDRTVSWKTGTDVSRLSGQPVRLRFQLQDADLYAMPFGS